MPGEIPALQRVHIQVGELDRVSQQLRRQFDGKFPMI
jgi:hypothetical protein